MLRMCWECWVMLRDMFSYDEKYVENLLNMLRMKYLEYVVAKLFKICSGKFQWLLLILILPENKPLCKYQVLAIY